MNNNCKLTEEELNTLPRSTLRRLQIQRGGKLENLIIPEENRKPDPWELVCPQCKSKNVKTEQIIDKDEEGITVLEDMEDCTCLDCGWNFLSIWLD